MEGIVFNIQRFTIHDGPGIRTEFFLKGCPLRCKWCSNPEGLTKTCQVGVFPIRCIGVSKCGYCVKACPNNALKIVDDKIKAIDRALCTNCFQCHKACPSDALKAWGYKMTLEEAMRVARADREFFERSGGGVTISGGEALLQWEFVRELLIRCKDEGIHTCVESALHVDAKILEEIHPYVDLMISDLKHMDSGIHRQYIGTGNELVLSNLRRSAELQIPLILRMPIIPDVNDSPAHIDAASAFIKENLPNALQVQFLRFRRLGEEKYDSLSLPYGMGDVNPGRETYEKHVRGLVQRMQEFGLPATAGTTTKISTKQ